ncbi:MAG TPA: DUF3501 family protein [Acidimicrobiia bacterium]|nr:DUF3501 family protein [Acidimicrobiia bacterium]
MRKLTLADIKDLREYERERDAFRAEIIAMKKRRRVPLGDLMTIVFENAATMRFQIQEMARAERLLRDEQIEHELDTYNELIPGTDELSGTLFIEITDDEALRYWLPRLVGIHEHVLLVAGGESSRALAVDVERLTRQDTTATVHYLKFAVDSAQRLAFNDGPVRLVVDHPEYQADVTLTDPQREELAGDLAP